MVRMPVAWLAAAVVCASDTKFSKPDEVACDEFGRCTPCEAGQSGGEGRCMGCGAPTAPLDGLVAGNPPTPLFAPSATDDAGQCRCDGAAELVSAAAGLHLNAYACFRCPAARCGRLCEAHDDSFVVTAIQRGAIPEEAAVCTCSEGTFEQVYTHTPPAWDAPPTEPYRWGGGTPHRRRERPPRASLYTTTTRCVPRLPLSNVPHVEWDSAEGGDYFVGLGPAWVPVETAEAVLHSVWIEARVPGAGAECLVGDRDACQQLVSFCMLQGYRAYRSACRALHRMRKGEPALLEGVAAGVFGVRYQHNAYIDFAGEFYDESALPLRVLRYDLVTGRPEPHGFRPLRDSDLFLCSLPSSYMDYFLKTGTQGAVTCRFNLDRALRTAPHTAHYAYEVFIENGVATADAFPRDRRGSSAPPDTGYLPDLQPIPVVVHNDRGTCSPDRDAPTQHYRFFLQDAVSVEHVVRYASDVTLYVPLNKTGTINTPYLCVKYNAADLRNAVEADAAPLPAAASSAAAPATTALPPLRLLKNSLRSTSWTRDVTVGAVWIGDDRDTRLAMKVACSLVVAACALWALLKAFIAARRRPGDGAIPRLDITGHHPGAGVYWASSTTVMDMPTWQRGDGARLQASPDGHWIVLRDDGGEKPAPHTLLLRSAELHGGRYPTLSRGWCDAAGAPAAVRVMGRSCPEVFSVDVMARALCGFCDALVPWLLTVLWLGCCAHYLEFKHHDSPGVRHVRGLPVGLGPFFPVAVTVLTAALLTTALRHRALDAARFLLLDWDTPRGVDWSSGDAVPVSMWRKVFCYNQLFYIATYRRWRTLFVLAWTLWLLLTVGYQNLTTADGTLSTRHKRAFGVPADVLHVPGVWGPRAHPEQQQTHPVLRAAVTGFFVVFASLIWAILEAAYLWLLPESPATRFADVLTQCNVSMVALGAPGWGYYIHGQKGTTGERSLRELWTQPEEMPWDRPPEEQGRADGMPRPAPASRQFPMTGGGSALGFGTALPPPEYELYMGTTLYHDVRRRLLTLPPAARPPPSTPRRRSRCFECLGGATIVGLGPPPPAQLAKAADDQEAQLRTLLDGAVKSAVPKFFWSLTNLLDLPPPNPLNPMPFFPPQQAQHPQQPQAPAHRAPVGVQLYAEPSGGQWAVETTLFGADAALHRAEMAVLVTVDALSLNIYTAATVVLVMYFGGVFLRRLRVPAGFMPAVDPRFIVLPSR
eukprot:TRINITY_DN3555_c0_g2_i1.p1 TRINITY_DN3555_c0_g2~~TRINITY_DN3555_c0_g2_i1.p1  ORF type:complete len:1211 (+),score=298.16 TRINITY_DN3555_c0_g2_i1:82-3714(+)